MDLDELLSQLQYNPTLIITNKQAIEVMKYFDIINKTCLKEVLINSSYQLDINTIAEYFNLYSNKYVEEFVDLFDYYYNGSLWCVLDEKYKEYYQMTKYKNKYNSTKHIYTFYNFISNETKELVYDHLDATLDIFLKNNEKFTGWLKEYEYLFDLPYFNPLQKKYFTIQLIGE